MYKKFNRKISTVAGAGIIVVASFLACVFLMRYQASYPEVAQNLYSITGAQAASQRIYGVTIDSIDNLSDIVKALSKHSKKVTVRIVFDGAEPASYYKSAISTIRKRSYVMGSILDSFYMKNYKMANDPDWSGNNNSSYESRVKDYINTLNGKVDIWEVGNEINGDWNERESDPNRQQAVANKIVYAYNQVKAKRQKAALTLFFCSYDDEHDMYNWAKKNVPKYMKNGLDYVFVSYYEDCEQKPNWPDVFNKLHAIFPYSKLGIGECGTTDDSQKTKLINQYYSLNVNNPYFVGGNFWWYYLQDAVPYTKPLWQVFENNFKKY